MGGCSRIGVLSNTSTKEIHSLMRHHPSISLRREMEIDIDNGADNWGERVEICPITC